MLEQRKLIVQYRGTEKWDTLIFYLSQDNYSGQTVSRLFYMAWCRSDANAGYYCILYTVLTFSLSSIPYSLVMYNLLGPYPRKIAGIHLFIVKIKNTTLFVLTGRWCALLLNFIGLIPCAPHTKSCGFKDVFATICMHAKIINLDKSALKIWNAEIIVQYRTSDKSATR